MAMGIRNPYLPAIANTWTQSQNFEKPASFQHGVILQNIANPIVLSTNGYGITVINTHDGIDLAGMSPQVFGLYSSQASSQFLVMDTNFNMLIKGHFRALDGKSANWISLGTTPVKSTPTIASGTVYQNTTNSYQTIDIPCYATTAGTAGTVAVAYGTSSTPSTIYTQYVSGSTSSTAQSVIHLRVPPQWYYEVTATGVTLGTATMIQE